MIEEASATKVVHVTVLSIRAALFLAFVAGTGCGIGLSGVGPTIERWIDRTISYPQYQTPYAYPAPCVAPVCTECEPVGST